MKVKIPHLYYRSDWTSEEVNEIETDDYAYFRIENRGSSVGDWWIEGYNKNIKREENLTGHGSYLHVVVDFFHNNRDKIKQINVLHFHDKNCSLSQFYNAYENYLRNSKYIGEKR